MRSERQALADIAKLCDRLDRDAFQPPGIIYTDYVRTIYVRSILADVQPEPVPMSRTDFTDPLDVIANRWLRHLEVHYDRSMVEDMAEDFRSLPAPAGGTIDRAKALKDAEAALVQRRVNGAGPTEVQVVVDAIIALVRPVKGGVVLTREEAALARTWYARLPLGVAVQDVALAERLEAAS